MCDEIETLRAEAEFLRGLRALRHTVETMIDDGHPNDPKWFAIIVRGLAETA